MTVDFHAHILPGADHGCRDRAMATAQLALIASGGTDTVVATPHFYPHRDNIRAFLARRAAAVERLLSCERPCGLRICLGAEVQVCEGLEELEELDRLCVQGTKVILLEMPHGKWSERLTATVLAIAEAGYTPVLAHVDRYPSREIEKLLKRGALAQLNADAFVGFFSRRRALRYLQGGAVVALGSDLHGADAESYVPFTKALRRLGEQGEQVLARSAALLCGAQDIAGKGERV